MTAYYTVTPSPLGDLLLTSNGAAITGLYTPQHRAFLSARKGKENAAPFAQAIDELHEYFAGKRTSFTLPLAPVGTPFQQQVWQALLRIPHGETLSYGALARLLGNPAASRAVGLANGKNPISIIVPCHRVIASNGKLTGYAGGLEAKAWLLAHEKGSPTMLRCNNLI